MSTDEITNRMAFGGESDLLAAELRKIVASTSDLHRHLMGLPYISPELIDPFSLLVNRFGMADHLATSGLAKLIAEAEAAHALQQEQWKDAFAATTRAWDQFDWKGIHEQFQQSLERADHVGKLGWTFSMDMTLPDIAELSDMQRGEDADAYMDDWYENNDPGLTESEKRISEMNDFSSFQPSLSQCFSAFRRRDYALTIPFLMAVVERGIQTLATPREFPSTDIKRIVTQRHKAAKKDFPNDSFMVSVLMSLNAFINHLFETSSKIDVNDHRPFRNAILHGNQPPPDKKIEVIRLVHAIQTIAACAQVDVKKAANPSASPPDYN